VNAKMNNIQPYFQTAGSIVGLDLRSEPRERISVACLSNAALNANISLPKPFISIHFQSFYLCQFQNSLDCRIRPPIGEYRPIPEYFNPNPFYSFFPPNILPYCRPFRCFQTPEKIMPSIFIHFHSFLTCATFVGPFPIFFSFVHSLWPIHPVAFLTNPIGFEFGRMPVDDWPTPFIG
jgi:hypothetical protein